MINELNIKGLGNKGYLPELQKKMNEIIVELNEIKESIRHECKY